MSDVRARLAEALMAQFSISREIRDNAYNIAGALLSLPDIAIVELPEPNDGTDWHIQDVGSAAVNSAFCGGGVRLLDVGFDLITTRTEARQYAAALLAAANAAEQATQ